MIKAVLFDYGGVLCPNGGREEVPKTLALIYGIEQDEVKVDDLHQQLLLGDITDQEFIDELNRRHPGSARLTKKMFFEKTDMLKRNVKVYDLAATLRQNGIKTGILSNVYGMTADLLEKGGQYRGFNPVVLSYEEHLKKPDTRFYEKAIGALGVDPREIAFIDDQEKCMPPAEALGIHTILAKTEGQIVADVKKLLKAENSLVL